MKPSSVTLAEMLDARERRANTQSAMLSTADASCCLVSLSLNIAGDVKRTAKTRLLFDRGLDLFDRLGFDGIERRVFDRNTGTEALLLLRADAGEVKAACERIEDAFPAARLYDFDVLNKDGVKLREAFRAGVSSAAVPRRTAREAARTGLTRSRRRRKRFSMNSAPIRSRTPRTLRWSASSERRRSRGWSI